MILALPEPPLSEMDSTSLVNIINVISDRPANHRLTTREEQIGFGIIHEVLRRSTAFSEILKQREEEARNKVKEAEANLQATVSSINEYCIEMSGILARMIHELEPNTIIETIPLSKWIDFSQAEKRMYAPLIDRGHVVVEGLHPCPQSKKRNRNGRIPLTTETRLEVIFRDQMVCQHCGKKGKKTGVGPDGLQWEIDHIIPVSKGGTNEMNNLVLSCKTCNQRKRDRWIEPAGRRE